MRPCDGCKCDFKPIPGDGPEPCPILFIGERPGKQENRNQLVFCGPAGEELNDTYLLFKAGIKREDVRITNACKCWEENNKAPTLAELTACSRYFLVEEIAACHPEVIVLLGATACKLLTISGCIPKDIKLDTYHGRPIWVKEFMGVYTGWVWLSYHPALGMHSTDKMTPMLEDFENLGLWLDGVWQPPKPVKRVKQYRYLEHPAQFTGYEIDKWCKPVGVDTETHGGEPFSMQFSQFPGVAWMVLAEQRRLIQSFIEPWLRQCTVIMHNAPGDMDTLDKLGCRLDMSMMRWRDTMQEAFHQCNLPQGLKPLVYRLFGAEMTSWEDTVRPASQEKLLDWLGEALVVAQKDLAYEERKQLKTKMKVTFKPGPVETALKRIIRHSNNPEYDMWEKLDNLFLGEDNSGYMQWQREYLEKRVGKQPILGIGNCTKQQALDYACGDADWTGQVGVELLVRQGGKRWEIQEGDEDAVREVRAA